MVTKLAAPRFLTVVTFLGEVGGSSPFASLWARVPFLPQLWIDNLACTKKISSGAKCSL